jgi:CubicO group peptidase (beta-lactamase class C family)
MNPSTRLSPAGLARVDQTLAAFAEKQIVPGVVVLVAHRGAIVHRAPLGLADLRSKTALSMDSIFPLFSMTKPVTAVAMMLLHERGLWSPDDPIAKHLPEFANLKGPRAAPPVHAPTMRELMTHTAGFGYGFGPPGSGNSYRRYKIWQAGDLDEFVRRVAAAPLEYQPGTKWRYSMSMDLQGAIIQRLSGQTLPDFMRSNIFAPLAMLDTDFYVPEAKRPRLVTLYHKYWTWRLKEVRHPMFRRDGLAIPPLPMGGAGLYSTATDYARFAQMLLNKGELEGTRLLSAAAVELMMRNHLSGEILGGGYEAGVHRFRPGYGYAFNGAIYHDPVAAGSPVGHGTYQWDGAGGSWFWIDPEHQLIFIGLSHRAMQKGMPRLQEITQRLIAEAMQPA